jgi:hypothetical protein
LPGPQIIPDEVRNGVAVRPINRTFGFSFLAVSRKVRY